MSEPKRRSVKKRREELELPPDVSNLEDLIRVAQTGKRYANINNEMLWRIVSQLIDINEMVGMEDLKRSIFYHVIFYLLDLYTDEERDYLHTVIMGPPGSGKCLGKDTPVLMYDGTQKRVQDILVGDTLMGDDSTPRTVLSVCSGVGKMYTVTPNYSNAPNDSYRVNHSHILSLMNTTTQEIEDITIREYLSKQHIYEGFRNQIKFRGCKEPSTQPYVLGYTLGCRVTAKILHREQLIILPEKVSELYHRYGYIQKRPFSVYDTCFEITNPQLLEIDETTITPYELTQYNHSDLLLILSGICDSIGVQKRGGIELVVQNEHLLNIVQTIVHILCIRYTLTQSRVDCTDTKIHLELVYTRILILNNIPSMIHDTVHYSASRDCTTFPITVTEEQDEDTYYGFEIDGNGRFVLGNYSVTHNTTIARIIGEMYKNMGILSSDGVFKVAKREDLVAEYLGQTAIKTKKLLESCLGGILFIDEVYALGPGTKDNDSFSKEAIDTINVFLSEHSDSFCCIIAGYEEDIKRCFFSVNQGLERRFQWVHKIESYSDEDLAKIFIKLLSEIRWKRDEQLTLSVITKYIHDNKYLFKSSGGDIENLITKCKMAHAKRIINQKNPKKNIITEQDIQLAIELMKKNTLIKIDKDDDVCRHLYL